MAKKIGMHFYIGGKVQGVWFRSSAQTVARKLGVTGWAANLPDGRLEIVAFGNSVQLSELRKWLSYGPPLAQVADFTHKQIPWQAMEDFEVR